MWIVVFSLFNLASSEVLLQAPMAPDREYRAFLTAYTSYSTPTAALLKGRPTAEAKEDLITRFAEAQRVFLSGDAAQARARFEEVLAQQVEQDWSAAEQRIFFDSALRRAQLAGGGDADHWLRLAAGIPGLAPDRTLFPPPLVRRFLAFRSQLAKRAVKAPGLGSDWSLILINGVACSADSCPAMADTGLPVRITYLSDKWQPFTTVAPMSRVAITVPDRKPWVNGGCGDPVFAPAAGRFAAKKAFFRVDCETPVAVQNLNLRPVARTDAITMFDPPKKARPFYKSPWLWAGVGAAAVIAVIVANNQREQRENKEPSTTYGY